MKIGVDVTCWDLHRGFGRHARCLLGALVREEQPHQYVFYTDDANFCADLPPWVEVVRVGAGARTIEAAAQGRSRSIWDMLRMSRALSDPSLDLVFFPTAFSFVPVFSRARKVIMILDVTAERFPSLTFGSWKDRLFFWLKRLLARWQADRLMTISEHSRDGLARQFGLKPESISVMNLAADPVFQVQDQPGLSPALLEAGLDPERRMLVYVGGFAPLKNVPGLVRAFASVAQQFPDTDLVLVGEDKSETFFSSVSELKDLVEQEGLTERVIFTGFVPDPELVGLLNLATVLALPSFNEGFGLPAVEAAACGCPVIATLSSPLPGLLGEGGLYVDPEQPQTLVQALTRMLGDEEFRKRAAERALEASADLSWGAAARRALACFEQASQ